jgi:hypothetical protein
MYICPGGDALRPPIAHPDVAIKEVGEGNMGEGKPSAPPHVDVGGGAAGHSRRRHAVEGRLEQGSVPNCGGQTNWDSAIKRRRASIPSIGTKLHRCL